VGWGGAAYEGRSLPGKKNRGRVKKFGTRLKPSLSNRTFLFINCNLWVVFAACSEKFGWSAKLIQSCRRFVCLVFDLKRQGV